MILFFNSRNVAKSWAFPWSDYFRLQNPGWNMQPWYAQARVLLKQEEVSFYLGNCEGTKGVTKVERAQTADVTECWIVQPIPLHPILGFPEILMSCICI